MLSMLSHECFALGLFGRTRRLSAPKLAEIQEIRARVRGKFCRAIDWVMERQCVKTDKDSGIVNDAND